MIVNKELSSSAHDLSHVYRVYKNGMEIAKAHGDINFDILKAACLLHDIAKVKEDLDASGQIDHAILGSEMASQILTDLRCDEFFINAVCNAIKTHRYRGKLTPETIEAKILYDADKLDILGAVGIARSYMIAGEYRQSLIFEGNQDEYILTNLVGSDINGRIKDVSLHTPDLEFNLKIRSIPNRLFTESAKEIAEKRLKFMELFYDVLYEEVKVV